MAGGGSRLRRIARRIGFSCASVSADICLFKTIRSPEESLKSRPCHGVDSKLSKTLCIICLEPLTAASAGGDGQAIFTGQCMHSFHFLCISSNVRHGSITCPVCRARWTQLPRDLPTADANAADSIPATASFRPHRRPAIHPVRYDDDEPLEPEPIAASSRPRLHMSLIPIPLLPGPDHHQCCSTPLPPHLPGPSRLSPPPPAFCGPFGLCLSVRLSDRRPTDIVLVVSPGGPRMGLLKQSMALLVFSLRAADRLAIVACSSVATRVLAFRRMTASGKRAALHQIDRLLYLGEADPAPGLRKAARILEERAHRNTLCSLLHLSDGPPPALASAGTAETPFPVHGFHVGLAPGAAEGFVSREFGEFLAKLLGGSVREARLRVGKDGGVVRVGELRVGEERRIPLGVVVGGGGCVCVGYSYVESGVEEFLRTGEMVVGVGCEKGEVEGDGGWCGHVDPFALAGGWAKHLHGFGLGG